MTIGQSQNYNYFYKYELTAHVEYLGGPSRMLRWPIGVIITSL